MSGQHQHEFSAVPFSAQLTMCFGVTMSMRTILENISPHQSKITPLLLVHLNICSLLIMSHHNRSTLLPDTRDNPVQEGISWRHILCFLVKILRPVTPLAGGLDTCLNFRTSLSLPVIFWQFQVRVLVCILSCMQYSCISCRFCCCSRKNCLWWGRYNLIAAGQPLSRHYPDIDACHATLTHDPTCNQQPHRGRIVYNVDVNIFILILLDSIDPYYHFMAVLHHIMYHRGYWNGGIWYG